MSEIGTEIHKRITLSSAQNSDKVFKLATTMDQKSCSRLKLTCQLNINYLIEISCKKEKEKRDRVWFLRQSSICRLISQEEICWLGSLHSCHYKPFQVDSVAAMSKLNWTNYRDVHNAHAMWIIQLGCLMYK